MANWCVTTYHCVGDQKEIESLKEVIDIVVEKYSDAWLGHVVDSLGFSTEKCQCGGSVTEHYMDNDVLVIVQMTPWDEQAPFRYAIQLKYPSIKVYYEVFCFEDGYSATNSFEHFSTRYYVYPGIDNSFWGFNSLDEAAKKVGEHIGHEVDATIQAINEALQARYGEGHTLLYETILLTDDQDYTQLDYSKDETKKNINNNDVFDIPF